MILFALAAPALAQTAQNNAITIGGSGPAVKTCVQVTIPGQAPSAFDCLNQELRAQAQAAAGAPAFAAPLGADSPANTTGTFNETGLAEQYGENFGNSVVPYRPPPPAFTNSVH